MGNPKHLLEKMLFITARHLKLWRHYGTPKQVENRKNEQVKNVVKH